MSRHAGVKTIAAALDAAAMRLPNKTALVSPFQEVGPKIFTYEELQLKTQELAGFLQAYGYERKDILVSDLPNVSENLMLQIACNRLGVSYATVPKLEGLAKLPKVKGAVSVSDDGYLAETGLPVPFLSGQFLMDLIYGGGLDEYSTEDNDQSGYLDDDDDRKEPPPPPHAYYNNTTPFTNHDALELGSKAAWELAMIEGDSVCVGVTLCHAFGMGSAVCSAFEAGASIVLPAVGGIKGCGIPSERAKATMEVLESEKCTLLFADTHTLEAMKPYDKPEVLNLRGGVCKVSSGADFLDGTVQFGGVSIKTMGKA
jgi:hypothetical protein